MRRFIFLALIAFWPEAPAIGAGLEISQHGARALGRAGAFVAGADDPSGIWYNPATIGGLVGVQVLADAALILYQGSYTRVDSGGNLLPTVSSQGLVVPIPMVALSLPVWRNRLYVGAAVTSPYSPYINYPTPSYRSCQPGQSRNCLDTAHTDAPQRYSVISNEGTKIVELSLAVCAKLVSNLYLGVSLQNLFVTYDTLSSISTYNGALSGGPENPEYDVLNQKKLQAMFNPSAKIGVLWSPHSSVRLGAAYQLPYWIRGNATINARLPASPLYERSSIEGNQAKVGFNLPMSVRAGVEWIALRGLRLELDFEWAKWSDTRAITAEPQDMYINNLPSIDRYRVAALEVPLRFQDSYAGRFGAEYYFSRLPLVLRGGYMFERGAVENKYASALSLDNDKHVVTIGAGYTLWGVRVDVAVARSFSPTRVVDYRESQSYQVNPINQSGAPAVGGGTYQADFTIVSFGVRTVF